MNALVSHPDIIRWVIWSWKSDTTWYKSVYNLFDMILNEKIDICITNSTLTIFENNPIDVTYCPNIVKKLYMELKSNKDKYFNSITVNNVFRNFNYSQYRLNHILETKLDRLGWITWLIYWFIKFEPTKFFLMKDIIAVPLKNLSYTEKYKCTERLPTPPWIKEFPNDIKTIYTVFQTTIYDECLT